eukprot:sb/3472206/
MGENIQRIFSELRKDTFARTSVFLQAGNPTVEIEIEMPAEMPSLGGGGSPKSKTPSPARSGHGSAHHEVVYGPVQNFQTRCVNSVRHTQILNHPSQAQNPATTSTGTQTDPNSNRVILIDDFIRSAEVNLKIRLLINQAVQQEPNTSKQPIRTRYLGHVTGFSQSGISIS